MLVTSASRTLATVGVGHVNIFNRHLWKIDELDALGMVSEYRIYLTCQMTHQCPGIPFPEKAERCPFNVSVILRLHYTR